MTGQGKDAASFKKHVGGIGHLGPCCHLGSPPPSSKVQRQHLLQSDLLHKRKEAGTFTTTRSPLSKRVTLSHSGVTSLAEHLENVTNDPREKILYTGCFSIKWRLILILLVTSENRMGPEQV